MSTLQNFELIISEVVIPNYSGPVKCALVLANFSTTVSIPCKPVNLVNLKLDATEKLYLSIFTSTSEVGCLEVPYSAFMSGSLESRYRLHENSISPEKERGQFKSTGEICLKITRLEEICIRCEGLEKLVRDIKVNLDDIEETYHNHPNNQPTPIKAVGIKEEKKSGIKKPANKALRANKGSSFDIKASPQSIGSLLSPQSTDIYASPQNISIQQSGYLSADLEAPKPVSAFLSTPMTNDSELKKMLDASYKSRQELQQSVSETTDQLSKKLNDQRTLLEQALADRSDALDQVFSLTEKIAQLEEEVHRLKDHLAEKESMLEMLKPKVKSGESYENELNSLTNELEKSIHENSDLEKKLQSNIENFGLNNNALNKRIKELTEDKNKLMAQVEEILKENRGLKQDLDKYSNLLSELQGKISLLTAELDAANARESREKHLLKLLKDEEDSKRLLKKELDSLSKKFSDQSNKSSADSARQQQLKKQLDSDLADTKQQLKARDAEVLTLKKDLEKAHSEISALQQHLCIAEDLSSMIDQLSHQKSGLEENNTSLITHLNNLKETIESQSKQLRSQEKKIAIFETERQQHEEQLTSLENLIEDLRKDRDIYKPVKDDPIDIALSDYVNTRPVNMKVQFDREDQGIYNFGTKKIFVKLEQGKLVIRVGGGYMQVDDFVKLYSPVELERFSHQKMEQAQKMRQSYLGKYAESLAVPKGKSKSPERAIKLLKDQMASGSYTPYYAVQVKSPSRSSNRSPLSERMSRDSN